jgi:hypothetical protein
VRGRVYVDKQGAGGECLAVAWEGPGIKRRTVQGQFLSPFDGPAPTR